jgi:hypothetical protein
MILPIVSCWWEKKSVTREGHQVEVLQNRSRKMMFGHKRNEFGCCRLYDCQTLEIIFPKIMNLVLTCCHLRDCDRAVVQCGRHENGTLNSSGGNTVENILYEDHEGDGSLIVRWLLC